jgi:hypothetical protein
MGALLEADMGPDVGGMSTGREGALRNCYWPASRSALAWSAGNSL